MAGGGPRYEDDEGGGQMIADINVTPLVDITLVLLIIFMVTASFIVNPSLHLDLPKAASGVETQRSLIGVSLRKDGSLYLNGQKTSEADLRSYIPTVVQQHPDVRAIISAEKEVEHGNVVHLIDIIKEAGVTRFAISTSPEGE